MTDAAGSAGASGAGVASALPADIDELWERRASLTPADAVARDLVYLAVDMIDAGQCRVAWIDLATDQVVVDERAKRAILLAFRLMPMVAAQVGEFRYHDRVPLTTRLDDVRAVPGSIVRWGAYVAPGAVLMPSFVNIGAYVDSGTMVDTWATVGSCAQIGKNCHLSGGVGIGGVLEPLQAEPVIIEDDCFIGARSEVVEGVIVEQGAVLAMGTFISSTTKIVNRTTGEIVTGRVPSYSVVVPGSLPGKPLPDGSPGPNLYCAVIVKRVDAQTRAKTSINELLRD
jgi:2,3,4,5-tetrahydropyridine-2,6-dicarboxylate N-succinyltransferase